MEYERALRSCAFLLRAYFIPSVWFLFFSTPPCPFFFLFRHCIYSPPSWVLLSPCQTPTRPCTHPPSIAFPFTSTGSIEPIFATSTNEHASNHPGTPCYRSRIISFFPPLGSPHGGVFFTHISYRLSTRMPSRFAFSGPLFLISSASSKLVSKCVPFPPPRFSFEST